MCILRNVPYIYRIKGKHEELFEIFHINETAAATTTTKVSYIHVHIWVYKKIAFFCKCVSISFVNYFQIANNNVAWK